MVSFLVLNARNYLNAEAVEQLRIFVGRTHNDLLTYLLGYVSQCLTSDELRCVVVVRHNFDFLKG